MCEHGAAILSIASSANNNNIIFLEQASGKLLSLLSPTKHPYVNDSVWGADDLLLTSLTIFHSMDPRKSIETKILHYCTHYSKTQRDKSFDFCIISRLLTKNLIKRLLQVKHVLYLRRIFYCQSVTLFSSRVPIFPHKQIPSLRVWIVNVTFIITHRLDLPNHTHSTQTANSLLSCTKNIRCGNEGETSNMSTNWNFIDDDNIVKRFPCVMKFAIEIHKK